MNQEERRLYIIDLLEDSNALTIQNIAEKTKASEATVRRDIVYLESLGLLKRFWGGVQRVDTNSNLREDSLKNYRMPNNINAIGRIAASKLEDNQLIFIGSGVTTLSMIQFINNKNIFVITNGIPQLEALNKKGIQALLLCGFYKEYSKSLVGKETLEMLKKYKFDAAFIGVNGIDDNLGLLSVDDYEEDIKRICLDNSKNTYVLADKDKFFRTAFYSLAFEEAREATIITDEKPFVNTNWQSVGGGYMGKIKLLSNNQ